MKNLVYLVVVVFMATTFIGCGKKKTDESMAMEGLNGVVSENVVSVDSAAISQVGEMVPVVVDNAQAAYEDGQMVAMEAGPVAGKATPKQIQQALKNAGVYSGKIDGEVGPKTKKAIEAFQAQNGLKADGNVGAKTWKVLAGYLNKTTEVDNPTAAIQVVGQ